ncbi:acyl transferase domain-containing protein [Xylaria nigripes]|nr:acyl transferase domain-containing protein [Xylaria nigripes]
MAEINVLRVNDYYRGAVPASLLAVDSESVTPIITAESYSNSDGSHKSKGPVPVAICGMATRLPGGISSPEQLWEFLLKKGDGRVRIPANRFATHPRGSKSHSADGKDVAGPDSNVPHWKTHAYMLDHVDLAAFDSGLFSMTRAEVDIMDPQQRVLLEITRECFESAGEVSWRGKNVGVYIGTYGEDWNDIQYHDRQDSRLYKLTGAGDFVMSNRISYEYDLKGPSLVLKTGCSASIYGLHLAFQALQTGEICGALVGGANLIMHPSKIEAMFDAGVLSKGASSRSFDADANGYARGEAVSIIYVKRLDDALRDGNPIRAVIRGTASNCDGKTLGLTKPGSAAHEALIRASYSAAGLKNEIHRTGFFECHAPGTPSGDPEEGKAVANVFGNKGGVYIGSVKPNLGHSEGASGLTSLLKCVMALENRIIPPNIKFQRPNPNIPFAEGGLRVPTEAIPWPKDREERVSVNSFGVGGSNAHVIIDSAASFGIRKSGRDVTTGNRLVVSTASSVESARRGIKECSHFIANHPEELNDIAYTLGMRREHLSCRAFAIVDSSNSKDVVFSEPVKTSTVTSSIAFIFTGQGAQWPTMGAALLSEYPSAMQDLQDMEETLSTLGQGLAPNWNLSEELLRSKDSSLIYKAEFSQPLCTAVQILIVNLLRDWGIQPAAVLGHSSGEIAAAYACGALTMQEAIICGFLRGRATKQPTETPGAMAAVGLGSIDVQPYLVDGVVVACENSPFNTTLSGDEDKLVQVLQAVKHDHPDVLSRRLQVDMAYHSHHMKKIGQEYERQLAPYVSSKAASVPFFSTVTGKMITDDSLNAAYWRSNLESPVLFNTGVRELLESQGMNSVLVEVGPHSALSGPLRQILSHMKAEQALYLPTLARSSNESTALLSTAGQLFCKGLGVRFDSINPGGRVVPCLPTYPWNHDTKYWSETRISRDYRGRRFPHHPLIGSRAVEVSQFEPTWRNLLRLDKIPWCLDHKVGSDVVFPATGYLTMAAEGIKQLFGDQDVSLRQVTIASALVLGPEPTEVILSMRPQKLTNSLDSSWHEFTISSHDESSDSWAKHCFGLVKTGNDNAPKLERPITHLPREVDPAYLYKASRDVGLIYGPQFQGLGRTSTHLLHNVAVADLRLDTIPESDPLDGAVYDFHPATSDACLQLMTVAAARGQARLFHRKTLPTYIGDAYFKKPQGTISAEATVDVLPNGSTIGTCIGTDTAQSVVMQLKDVKLIPLDDGDSPAEDPHAAGRLFWKPDIDFQDASRLIKSEKKVREAYFRLQRLVLLCCISARDEIRSHGTQIPSAQPHLAKYRDWIFEQVEQAEREGYPLVDVSEVQELLQLSPDLRTSRIAQYLQLVLETEYATIGRAVYLMHESLGDIYRGNSNGLEILRQDNTLAEIYNLGDHWDYKPWLRLLSHRTPHLRVLEIGAGTGGTTDIVLRSLDTFLSYVYTDVSPGFFPAAKERFSQYCSRMQFQALDISSDPITQGFQPHSFDLIIASNVLHVTPNLKETLTNVRKLLRPNGRLLLQEMYVTVKWMNFIMGFLPGWWLGEEDGRYWEPYVSPERWSEELLAAGFSAPEASIFDDEVPFQANVTMIASPNITWKADPVVYLLSGNPEGKIAKDVSTSLRNLGLAVEHITLEQKPQGFVISILDLEGKSFLRDISQDLYVRFKEFLSELTPFGLLWLSRPSQMYCLDPQYSPILGLLRVVHNETNASFFTLELDDTTSQEAWQAVLKVYQKIARMRDVEKDELVDPDYEFAYSGGTIYIPRFHWLSVNDELATQPEGQRTCKRLEIGKRGSLSSLQWIERPLPDNLTGEDVYIDIRAVGMNFKDTLIAMGIVNGPKEAGDGFGLECSGVVRAVGPGVTDLTIGDRVMAMTQDAYATTTRTAASQCMKIPDELGFEEAASIPCIYPTVIHGLINLAHLEKGQTVLIHSACGGIGLAAINVCKMLGIEEIYTTVGSTEKVEYLVDTFGFPRSRIFSSRDAGFLSGIMHETGGQGVDVVLNSLSGELLHASWKCVAEFGSMVEIGKRDFQGQGRLDMESFEGNRAFFGIEMWPLNKQPHRIRKINKQFMEYYRTGALKPIQPIRVFDAADIESAIRTMQKGQHMGKLVVRIPEDASSIIARPAHQGFSFRADASYLLVGGLGGLGRSIAMWMVEYGAKHFIFLSRSGGTKPNEKALVQALEGAGCTVEVVMGSVTEIGSILRAIGQARAPIAGVIQLSMILRDHLFAEMPFEDWQTVTEPKIQGTWNLHTALAQQPLDFFVLFSSIAGLTGQRGQANYASANTFLDAFVQFRHRLGLPASVLDVGAISDVGYVAERPDLIQFFKTTSIYSLREQYLLDTLELAIRNSAPSIREPQDIFVSNSQLGLAMRSTLPLSSPQNRLVWRRDARLSMYHNIDAETHRDNLGAENNTGPGQNDQNAEVRRLLTVAETDPSAITQDAFVAQLARQTGLAFFNFMMKPVEELDVTKPLTSFAFDSLIAIELRNWLRLRFAIEISMFEIMRSENLLALARLGAKKWASKMATK